MADTAASTEGNSNSSEAGKCPVMRVETEASPLRKNLLATQSYCAFVLHISS